ncbi:hypothetical protein ONS96_013223 [Cadophora gregata f. sp. sojae]|nr:hypothetical protein ONS96_013223 [Cadophora gregata f. sp. sojae]
MRVFGWRAISDALDDGIFAPPLAPIGTKQMNRCGERTSGRCPGSNPGEMVLPDGTKVDAGRALMRETGNVDLHGPLLSAFQEGQEARRPDVIIYKNRNSALYDSSCELYRYLNKIGISSLLFAGMNTDQCVMGTLQDAHSRGFDTILLRDACATSNPSFAQQSAELNCCRAWGFLSDCKAAVAAAGMGFDKQIQT